MSPRALSTSNVGAAAVVLGGIVVVLRPEHALSVLQVVLVTLAAAAAVHALSAHVPPTGWISPFKWMSPFLPDARSARGRPTRTEYRALRALMAGRRQPLEGAPALPPAVLRALRPLVRTALHLDPEGERTPPGVRAQVSLLTWAVLTTEPLSRRAPWYRTRWSDPRAVADAVHQVLDELDTLKTPHHPRAK